MTTTLFSDITCGLNCWHAREDVCRCSCGGKNHGCMYVVGGAQPERTAKIDGEKYQLQAVGLFGELYAAAKELNGRQYQFIEPVRLDCFGDRYQYYYVWKDADTGAPARIKSANKKQLLSWPELSGWRDNAAARGQSIYLLWVRTEMPPRPTELRVNLETGEPLESQSPNDATRL